MTDEREEMRDGDIKEGKNGLLLTLLPCSRSKYINNSNESALCAILECFPGSRLLSKNLIHITANVPITLCKRARYTEAVRDVKWPAVFSQRVTLKQYSTGDGERERVKDVKDGAKIPS